MILDSIENIDRYKSLELLKKFKDSIYKKGKFFMDEEAIFGIGLEYDTKEPSEGLWEAHKKYLDVHLILEGEEKIHVSDFLNCKQTMDFDYENDYQLFEATMEQVVVLKKGSFLALYPNEVHKTGVKVTETVSVKKVVFKIEL